MSSAEGSQRATEVTSAMLNIPGYADDTMLFMLRYGSMAQETLRKVDWDEFMARLTAYNTHFFSSNSTSSNRSRSSVSVGSRGTGQGDNGEPEPEPAAAAAAAIEAEAEAPAEAASCHDDDGGVLINDAAVDPPEAGDKAAELKARALEMIQEFPRLVRDFDKFVDCTRIMALKYGRAPV
ncbi:hypothetical protein V8C42DRAFT_339281 [Trichoderma barbatum]